MKMTKKFYEKPQTEVIDLENKYLLMAGSNGVGADIDDRDPTEEPLY